MNKNEKWGIDLDGTLADIDVKYLLNNGDNHKDYFLSRKVYFRPPMIQGVDWVIITGRRWNMRSVTRQWLKNNGISYSRLIFCSRKKAKNMNNPESRKLIGQRKVKIMKRKLGKYGKLGG